jgi:hypothetical protein
MWYRPLWKAAVLDQVEVDERGCGETALRLGSPIVTSRSIALKAAWWANPCREVQSLPQKWAKRGSVGQPPGI